MVVFRVNLNPYGRKWYFLSKFQCAVRYFFLTFCDLSLLGGMTILSLGDTSLSKSVCGCVDFIIGWRRLAHAYRKLPISNYIFRSCQYSLFNTLSKQFAVLAGNAHTTIWHGTRNSPQLRISSSLNVMGMSLPNK